MHYQTKLFWVSPHYYWFCGVVAVVVICGGYSVVEFFAADNVVTLVIAMFLLLFRFVWCSCFRCISFYCCPSSSAVIRSWQGNPLTKTFHSLQLLAWFWSSERERETVKEWVREREVEREWDRKRERKKEEGGGGKRERAPWCAHVCLCLYMCVFFTLCSSFIVACRSDRMSIVHYTTVCVSLKHFLFVKCSEN